MKITLTLEDTPDGVAVDMNANGGAMDNSSLALLVASNTLLYINNLRLTASLKAHGNLFPKGKTDGNN